MAQQYADKIGRTLIVGGAGYVGGCLTDILSPQADVVVYDSLLYEDRYLKDVEFVHGDVRDRDKLLRIINDFDTIVWLAAVVGDGACTINPEATKTINQDSISWLVDNYKNGRVVFASTCSVYGSTEVMTDENSEINPLSLYASTKLGAEQYIKANFPQHLILRFGTLFGVGDRFSRPRFDLVVNTLTQRAITTGSLDVFGGEQWRPILHVRDAAGAIAFGIRNTIFGMYNVAYDNFRVSELAKIVAQHVDRVNINYCDMPYEDLRNYRTSSDAYRALGWSPNYDIHDGILEIVNILGRLKNPRLKLYSNHSYIGELDVTTI